MRMGSLIGWVIICALTVSWNAESTAEQALEGAPRIGFEETAYDFGQVREGAKVPHVYTFRNLGTDTLVLGKIRTTCGCTAALVSKREIPPGGAGEVKVTFSTRNYRGRQSKTITVHSNDPDQPRVRLSISGQVLVEVDIRPRNVNFGNIPKGQERTQTIMVRFPYDSKLRVTGVKSLTEGIRTRWVSSGSAKSVETEIQVTLSGDAPVGRLNGKVRISTNSPNKPTDTIMVFANVQGEIQVQPPVLSGVFRKGDPEAVRSVEVITRGKKNLEIRKVEENTGWFVIKVVEVTKGEHYRVELALKEEARPGRSQGMLRIHTNHPDQSVIEVRLSGVIRD